ncbi:hypothetical protein [Marinibactrum halimedae]|uniref:Lipoprotein n=1 Tax=Marinibactrum halimedae TaxID=1444977 RepID=A0AA37WPG1_9GAMM|nr:hypothetical protein [Marinibactrum halimedae]MCD9458662.1 hypothetical protein [Marinibactrum halimedae]GLS25972.1 hypothetical protein GCM10007877_16870 [Marinibactrum halimedae]
MIRKLLPVFTAAMISVLSGCGGSSGGSDNASNPGIDPDLTGLKSADANSPYANTAPLCVVAEAQSSACSFNTLPLIGMNSSTPSNDDILAHTVVSHDWMAERFAEVLPLLPEDLRGLFRGVTAIVIGSDIRPSFYSRLTGAMYIDPAYLWLTVAEKNTISTDDDFRAGFGNGLQFISLWTYLNGSNRGWQRFSLTDDRTRTIEDLPARLSALLYHELAHANDVFPPSMVGTIDKDDDPLTAVDQLEPFWASTTFSRGGDLPLTSDLLYDVAQVLFYGNEASQSILDLTGTDLGIEFELDYASDDYAYASQFEDVAMIFEEIMMHKNFGFDRVLAYTNQPDSNTPNLNCSHYIVEWGQRNRIGSDFLRPRVEHVLRHMLNKQDVSEYFVNLPEPVNFEIGESYCDNFSLTAPATTSSKSSDVYKNDLPVESIINEPIERHPMR